MLPDERLLPDNCKPLMAVLYDLAGMADPRFHVMPMNYFQASAQAPPVRHQPPRSPRLPADLSQSVSCLSMTADFISWSSTIAHCAEECTSPATMLDCMWLIVVNVTKSLVKCILILYHTVQELQPPAQFSSLMKVSTLI